MNNQISEAVKNTGRQAITTKYFGPTNSNGSRIKASCDAGSVYFRYDHSLNIEQNHDAACQKLLYKLGWSGEWQGGGTKGGYVYVNVIK